MKIPDIVKNKHVVFVEAALLLVVVSFMFRWAGANVSVDSGLTNTVNTDTITFHDDKRGTSFSIGNEQAIFVVQDFGQYVINAPELADTLPNGRKRINYRGPALLLPTSEGTLEPITTTVVLNGTIEPDGIRATVTISENSPKRQFQLTVSPPTENLMNAVNEHTSVVLEQDFSTMYDLTSGATLGDISPEEFAQIMNEQITNEGSITRIENLTEPQIERNPAGLIFFTIEQRVFFEKDGIESSQDVTSVFLYESDEWKFWFSEQL